MHSITKYLNGHSDVLMGAIMLNNEAVYEKLKINQIDLGLNTSSFDISLVLTSLKSFKVRIQEHMSNTLKIAKALEAHPHVAKVIYPRKFQYIIQMKILL